MYIDSYLDVINACRFCFMCRHLSTVGNVTFKEADTPRGRALILDKVRMDPSELTNPDYIDTLYAASLSAACRFHCVSHYDEVGLLLAARRDIVDAGLAPSQVKELADELKTVDFTVEGEGKVLYYVDPNSENTDAFAGYKTIQGGDLGKALHVLGFAKEAEAIAAKFKDKVLASGCDVLVTSCPASYDFLKNDSPLDGVDVLHSSEYLLSKEAKATDSRNAYYLDSDFLKNYNDNMPAPRELLKSLGFELTPFGTNQEESYSVSEGSVVGDKLNPELCERLCQRVYELADDLENDLFITASPYTKRMLKTYNSKINVLSIEEAFLQAVAGK